MKKMTKPNAHLFYLMVVINVTTFIMNYIVGNDIVAGIILAVLILIISDYLKKLKKFKDNEKNTSN